MLKIHKNIKIYYSEDVGFIVDYKGRRKSKYKFELTKEISEKVKKFIENREEKNFVSTLSNKEFVSKYLENREKQKEKNIYYCLCGPCGASLRKINNTIVLQFDEGKTKIFGLILKKREIEKIFLE